MMSSLKKIFPIAVWLPRYKRSYLRGDLSAGLTVGIILIPQGMAYAMIAGLPPVYGLYGSIVPQLIYAILGTSRQLSVAPVAMDSLLVAAGISTLATEGTEAYISLAILLALFMGVLQLLLGTLRMGFITNLLSKPVISGFTSAAAFIIGMSQLQHLLGTDIENGKTYELIWNVLQSLDDAHAITFIIGVFSLLLITLGKKLFNQIPAALLAVSAGIALVYFLKLDKYGVSIIREIPSGLPAFGLPQLQYSLFQELAPVALTIAVVSFMEAYSVGKAIETKTKQASIDANQELVALGTANIFGSVFQAYPVTGGFSRSAVNFQTGAKTPLSSVISAGLVALTLLFLTPIFYYLPKATLASIIIAAVISLVDVSYAKKLWHKNKIEFGLLAATFLVTLNFSMVSGITTGVALSILLLMYQAAYPHIAILGRMKGQTEFRNVKRFSELEVWRDRLIMRIDAPITFINIQYVKEFVMQRLESHPNIREVYWDASAVSHIDATAAEGISDMLSNLKEMQVTLVLTELVGPVRDRLFRTGLLEEIGEKNVYMTLNDAIESCDRDTDYSRRKSAVQHE